MIAAGKPHDVSDDRFEDYSFFHNHYQPCKCRKTVKKPEIYAFFVLSAYRL